MKLTNMQSLDHSLVHNYHHQVTIETPHQHLQSTYMMIYIVQYEIEMQNNFKCC